MNLDYHTSLINRVNLGGARPNCELHNIQPFQLQLFASRRNHQDLCCWCWGWVINVLEYGCFLSLNITESLFIFSFCQVQKGFIELTIYIKENLVSSFNNIRILCATQFFLNVIKIRYLLAKSLLSLVSFCLSIHQ